MLTLRATKKLLQRVGPPAPPSSPPTARLRQPSDELEYTRHWRTAPTANRSVVGVMNEFVFLANGWRTRDVDLLGLSTQLAATPCGPLYGRNISPVREFAAHLRAIQS